MYVPPPREGFESPHRPPWGSRARPVSRRRGPPCFPPGDPAAVSVAAAAVLASAPVKELSAPPWRHDDENRSQVMLSTTAAHAALYRTPETTVRVPRALNASHTPTSGERVLERAWQPFGGGLSTKSWCVSARVFEALIVV